jgi:hypothetical protein
MLATSSQLATLLTSWEQSGIKARLSMTLPGNVYPDLSLSIESLSIEASITTDMPDGTRLAAGYPAMQATFTLSGMVDQTNEKMTAAWLFGLYAVPGVVASPLLRKSVLGAAVTIDLGAPPVGTTTVEYVRKFTGTVDSLTIDPISGTVAFTCIDMRNKLRTIPALPGVITAPPFNAGLTSEFAIDALLRAATKGAYSSWPAARANCVLAVGFRSSMWPDIGALDSGIQPVPTFSPGKFGTGLHSLLLPGASFGQALLDLAAPITGTSVFMEFWTTTVGPSDQLQIGIQSVFLTDQAWLTVTGSGITLTVSSSGTNNTQNWSVPVLGSGSHHIGLRLTMPAVGGTTWTATLYVDGTPNATNANITLATARTSASFVYAFVGMVTRSVAIALEALQITTESGSPVGNFGFVPKAILEPSLNALQIVPSVEAGTDPWNIIQQIADAELGVAGFDEAGLFHFYNRNTIRARPVSLTLTATTDLKSLQMTSDASAVVNHVTVPYTAWSFGKRGLIYTLADIWSVAPRSTKVFPISIDGTVGSIDVTASVLPDGHTVSDGASWYRASTTAAGNAPHPGITVTIGTNSSGPIVTITNPSTQWAYLVDPATYTDTNLVSAGQPSLWIGGIAATASDEVTVDYQYPDIANGGAASSPRGDVALAVASDPWIQDGASAARLALDLLIDLYLPRPNFDALDIVPDWRLQLLDRVRIQDFVASGVDEYAQIWGWSITFDASTWGMTVDARTVTSPGQWILGVAGRSELGATTYI